MTDDRLFKLTKVLYRILFVLVGFYVWIAIVQENFIFVGQGAVMLLLGLVLRRGNTLYDQNKAEMEHLQRVSDRQLKEAFHADARAADIAFLWKRLDFLRDEFWDEDGRPPSPVVLASTKEFLTLLLSTHSNIPRPKVYPTPEGHLQAEWILGNWAVTALFDYSGTFANLDATEASGVNRSMKIWLPAMTEMNVRMVGDWLSKLPVIQ